MASSNDKKLRPTLSPIEMRILYYASKEDSTLQELETNVDIARKNLLVHIKSLFPNAEGERRGGICKKKKDSRK